MSRCMLLFVVLGLRKQDKSGEQVGLWTHKPNEKLLVESCQLYLHFNIVKTQMDGDVKLLQLSVNPAISSTLSSAGLYATRTSLLREAVLTLLELLRGLDKNKVA
jgi:hypothetical protein